MESIMTNRSPLYNAHLNIYKMVDHQGLFYWQNVRDDTLIINEDQMRYKAE
jgi:hypothetical protein